MLITSARAQDLAGIAALLRAAQLPDDDLDVDKLDNFLVLRGAESDGPGGAIGFEPHGEAALLRSLVVAPARRVGGHGRAMVTALELRARRCGIRELFLLTTTAEAFFARLGYTKIPRESAPAALQATREFAALCPSSAVCMNKTL